jgi:putative endonuclease
LRLFLLFYFILKVFFVIGVAFGAKVVGSNPATPTKEALNRGFFIILLYFEGLCRYRVVLERQERRFESCHPIKAQETFFMSYYVYIIYSDSLSQYYTGYCADFEKRLREHNSGYSKHTSKGMPWKVILVQEHPTKTIALQLENKIKKRGAKRYLEDMKLL